MLAPSSLKLDPALVGRLYEQARAARWNVPLDRFEAALAASLAHASSTGGAADAERVFSALHLEDLALAVACAAGLEPAWEHFMAEHRLSLSRAAAAIDPAGGSDLADSVYAELFGLRTKDGERQSLFRYYHGRSKLGTWLRAILAQRHVDRIRESRRHDPLPDDEDGGHQVADSRQEQATPERARFVALMREALSAAIAALEPRDRLRLSSYYAQDMTLAAIGRMLGEHEATVSRHLTRSRQAIRLAAESRLRSEHHLDDQALSECFRSVSEDAGALDLADLFGIEPARKIGTRERSKK